MSEQDRIPTDGSVSYGPGPEAVPPNAGAPGYASPPPAPGGPTRAPGAFSGIFPPGTNDFAILSLVIAIGGMATGMVMATSPVSIVLGFMGLSRIKRTGERGREMAIAGILIGFLMLLVSVLLVVGMFVYMFVYMDMYRDLYTTRY